MPKGGARANSGPAPDPTALRRDRPSDAAGWTTLSADGRQGDAPEFPLCDQTLREVVLWAAEWVRPQAIEWERNGQQVEVAMYVRSLADAEKPDAAVAARTLVKQLQESLGISLPGLHRLRWKIGDTEPSSTKPSQRRGAPAKSASERLRVIQGGGDD